MTMPPRIGISCEFWTYPTGHVSGAGPVFDRVKQAYSLHVAKREGLPLLLPNLHDDGRIDDYLALLDGLLLHGGGDVEPAYFNQEPRCVETCHIQPIRDAFELPLVRKAIQCGLPVLGICRGAQIINIAMGGEIFQDMSLRPDTQDHRAHKDYVYRTHEVSLIHDSLLATLAGRETLPVSSSHHQLLGRLAKGLHATAHSADGVVEAVESMEEERFLVGVQWHPEDDQDSLAEPLFDAFMEAARTFKMRQNRQG